MRIWSLHPRQLDRQALIACWRETLLAQAVLAGRTNGYQRHPQLERFREADGGLSRVGGYLLGLAEEADARGYRFDRERIQDPGSTTAGLTVTDGQLAYEWGHLLAKLEQRSPEAWRRWRSGEPEPHPLFRVVAGPIAAWERPAAPRPAAHRPIRH